MSRSFRYCGPLHKVYDQIIDVMYCSDQQAVLPRKLNPLFTGKFQALLY